MPNNTAPGNEELTKNLRSILGETENNSFLSFNKAFRVGKLSVSQKQAIIKLTEKRTNINKLLKTGDQFLFSMLTKFWFQKL